MRSKPFFVMMSGALILCLTIGMGRSYGVFLPPMTKSLEIGRNVFAFAIALQNILWGLFQPFAGILSDRFGAARVMTGGALLYLLGLATMGLSTGPVSLCLSAGLLIGLGISATSFSVVLGAVGRLVAPEKRAMALAVASTGGSFGQFMMIPVSQVLISANGWARALIFLALSMALIVPLTYVLRGKAAEFPSNAGESAKSPTQAITEALRHRGYRFLTAGFFVCGFHVVFISTHLPAYLVDQGMSTKMGVTAVTFIGFFNIIGTYLWGLYGGRYSKKHLLSALYLLRAMAMTLLIVLPKNEITVLLFSAAMGFLWLGTVPLTSGLVAQIFGPRYMSTLFGVVYFSHQIGAFLGVWLGGYVFDVTRSYTSVWVLSVLLSLAATALHLRIDVEPEKTPEPPADAELVPVPD